MNIPPSLIQYPPRKEVLLLTCMDLRLLDNTTQFMNQLNLQNRYDHLVLAGAAMGARYGESKGASTSKLPWKNVFFDHLATAINELKREIKDIFLLEHLDCGAYKVLEKSPVKDEYKRIADTGNLRELVRFHSVEAHEFADDVREFCQEQADHPGKNVKPEWWQGIRVHCLVMDLLGKVEDL